MTWFSLLVRRDNDSSCARFDDTRTHARRTFLLFLSFPPALISSALALSRAPQLASAMLAHGQLEFLPLSLLQGQRMTLLPRSELLLICASLAAISLSLFSSAACWLARAACNF